MKLWPTQRWLNVPDCCLPQLLAQRTGCRTAADPAAAWADTIFADWDQVAPYIPDRCGWALDIGCGLAGFDILLHRACGAFLWLQDMDRVDDRIHYGFGADPSAYCRLGDVAAMMSLNEVRDSAWQGILSPDEVIGRVDLVTSFLAWGFHFPVEVYLPAVSRMLATGGILILDIRKEHWIDEVTWNLRLAIGPLLKIWPHEKHYRCVYMRGSAR